jgi:alpha-tubulin suppressor-like RCC1 family protein
MQVPVLFGCSRPGRLVQRPAPALTLIGFALLLGCREQADSPVAPGSDLALVAAASATLAFNSVAAGEGHTCGVTTSHLAYCWGGNIRGALGDGTQTPRSSPTLVKGGLRFRQISGGQYHSCGVTTVNLAYCWGENEDGQLGDGTHQNFKLKPVAVTGGRLFRQVSAGYYHTCGVTTDDRVFCWGSNWHGQLGNGTSNTEVVATAPMAVAGSLRFRGVSSAAFHSCGVTTDNRAYCWGGDQWGQVGDGAGSDTCGLPGFLLACRTRPTRVAGGHLFRQVDAGGGLGPGEGGVGGTDGGRTCGVTTDNRAFCWGDGSHGQNGDGTQSLRSAPRAVVGGHLFRSVSAGLWHTCALTMEDLAYCWGWNLIGQLGDGTKGTMRLRPRAVSGSHLFRQLSAGGAHTCGTTPGDVAYCWGGGGQLTPQPVAGGL